jgi:hypothetical protein
MAERPDDNSTDEIEVNISDEMLAAGINAYHGWD